MVINQAKSLFQGEEDAFTGKQGFYGFSPLKFFLLLLAASVILFLRRPEALLSPQFYAEDGTVFFKDAYELPFWTSVFKPYAGYFHVIPRIFAECISLFPVRYAPLFYNSFSLLIAAVSFCWIWLPHFRHLIRSDLARLFVALLFLFSPNQEALMKLAYAQWYILLWLTLCCFMLPLRSRSGSLLLTVAILLSVWTSAISFILLPVWILRIFFVDHFQKKLVASVTAASLAVLAAIFFVHSSDAAEAAASTGISADLVTGMLHAIIYKVICTGVLGPTITFSLFSAGWTYVYAASFVLILLTVAFYNLQKREMLIFTLACLYIGIASVFFFILRSNFVLSFVRGEGVRVHDRYFFLASSLLILMLFTTGYHYAQKKLHAPWNRILPSAALVVWAALYAMDFPMQWTRINFEWAIYAKQIEYAEKAAALNGQSYMLQIPINPFPWRIQLRIGQGTNSEHSAGGEVTGTVSRGRSPTVGRSNAGDKRLPRECASSAPLLPSATPSL